MELYQLEAFEAAARLGSFTRAAEALCITQPAVTRQVAALEAELHTRLFDRLGRTVALTRSGEALRGYAETILRTAREAREAIADVGSGAAGRLAVGASSTLATYVLPDHLRAYHQARPGVEIVVHTGASADIVEMVLTNEADLGLVTAELADERLRAVALSVYETRVVVPPDHPLAARESLEARDLAGIPLILMGAGANLRAYVDRVLGEAGVAEQISMEMDNVEAIKRMVEAGLGISMLPEVAVRSEVAAGRLCALRLNDVPRATRRVRLIRRRDKYVNAAMRAFLEVLGAGE